jgi:hypothetical protein
MPYAPEPDDRLDSMFSDDIPSAHFVVMKGIKFEKVKGGGEGKAGAKNAAANYLIFSPSAGLSWIKGNSDLGAYHSRKLKNNNPELVTFSHEAAGERAEFTLYSGTLSLYLPSQAGVRGRPGVASIESSWRSCLGLTTTTTSITVVDLPKSALGLPPLSASRTGNPAIVLTREGVLTLKHFSTSSEGISHRTPFRAYAASNSRTLQVPEALPIEGLPTPDNIKLCSLDDPTPKIEPPSSRRASQ